MRRHHKAFHLIADLVRTKSAPRCAAFYYNVWKQRFTVRSVAWYRRQAEVGSLLSICLAVLHFCRADYFKFLSRAFQVFYTILFTQ